ncbi:MAG: polyprenyl diphosphate synthase [Bacillus subtilis]|nr:polyprenyl diphosphate synthase [Bacillus subtilis]
MNLFAKKTPPPRSPPTSPSSWTATAAGRQQRGMPRTFGHQAGVENIRKVALLCSEFGVKALSVFAFSTENWKRPQPEVDYLMKLPGEFEKKFADDFKKHDVKVMFSGRRTQLSPENMAILDRITSRTADRKGLVLNICFDYGSITELTEAVQAIAEDVAGGDLQPVDITARHDRIALCIRRIFRRSICSSAPRANSGFRTSCSGRRPTPNSGSHPPIGPPSAAPTSSRPSIPSASGTAGSAASRKDDPMKRILTAVAMAAVLIPILIWGDRFYIFDAFCLIAAAGAAWELRAMTGKTRPQPRWLDAIAIVLCRRLRRGALRRRHVRPARFPPRSSCSSSSADSCSSSSRDSNPTISATSFPPPSTAPSASRRSPCSANLSIHFVVYILLGAMLTDTAAYFFGTRFGRHRLCPAISPKKSIEGAVAGTVFGAAATIAYAFLVPFYPAGFHPVVIILVSVALPIVAQIGDLVASKLKRSHGIKDYSNLFPGHGGILDRFDSTMFSAAFMVLVLLIAMALSVPLSP